MHIPRNEYCKEHLEEWMDNLAVTNWFEYLDQSDRLMRVLERGRPFSISMIKQFNKNKAFVCWEEFSSLVTENWYGLWPNATDKELEVAEAVIQLHIEWFNCGGFHDSDPLMQSKIKARYESLLKDYEQYLINSSVDA